jgi:hypothetical protein
MQIELERTYLPEDLGDTMDCAICGDSFELGVVFPVLLTNSRMDAGNVCLACIEFLSHHPSKRFPSLADYWRLDDEWKTTRYASQEEADRDLEL